MKRFMNDLMFIEWVLMGLIAAILITVVWSGESAKADCEADNGSYEVVGYYNYWVHGNPGFMATGAKYKCVWK